MTRYEIVDNKGRPLYRGQVVNGRRWAPWWRVGWATPIMFGTLTSAILVTMFDWPILPVTIVAALLTQAWITTRQVAYSRRIWTSAGVFAEEDLPERRAARAVAAKIEPTPEQRERQEEIDRLTERRDHLRISQEAGLHFIDYEDGTILTVPELPDALAEAERELEAIKTIGDMSDHLDALPEQAPAPIEMWHHDRKDLPEPNTVRPYRPEIIKGRPADPSAARKARLSDGRVVELTNGDLEMIIALGGMHFGPARAQTSSGEWITSRDMAGLAEEIRALGYFETCPHGIARHLACATCVIDLRTKKGEARAYTVLHGASRESVSQARSSQAGQGRTRAVIRADLDQLAGQVRAGKLGPRTANSLRAALMEEWSLAAEDGTS